MTIIHTRVDIHGNSTQEKRLRGFKTSHEWSLIHRYKYIYIPTPKNGPGSPLLHTVALVFTYCVQINTETK